MENAALDNARCLGCRYSLRGLPEGVGRCPECGRGFDRRDPRTYDDGSPDIKWVRWARPPGWIHAIATLYLTWRIFDAAGDPWGARTECWAIISLPLILYYLVRAGIAFGVWSNGQQAVRRHSKLWWLPMPLCVAVVAGVLITELPARMRFEASRTALESEAHSLLTAPTTAPVEDDGEWQVFDLKGKALGKYAIGLLRVDVQRQHVYFFTGGFVRGWGIVFTGDSRDEPFLHHRHAAWLPDGWALFVDEAE